MPSRRRAKPSPPRTVLIPPREHCWVESDAYDRSAFAALVADAPSLAAVVDAGGRLVPHFDALLEDVFCLLFKLEPRWRDADQVARASALAFCEASTRLWSVIKEAPYPWFSCQRILESNVKLGRPS